MNTSVWAIRKSPAVLAAAAALALAGIFASSASAAEWAQGETSMRWSAPTVTLKKSGGSEVECSLGQIKGSPGFPYIYGALNTGGYAHGGVNNEGAVLGFLTRLSCDGSTSLDVCTCIAAEEEIESGVFGMYMEHHFSGTGSPYGTYLQEFAEGTFTNGSGGQPSTLTFDEAQLGRTLSGQEPITISGTIEVSQGDGSLLTLTN